jgi:hypothetical protein
LAAFKEAAKKKKVQGAKIKVKPNSNLNKIKYAMKTVKITNSDIKFNLSVFMLGIFFLSTECTGQVANRQVVNNSILWTSTSSNVKLSKKINVFLDGHYRFASATGNGKAFDKALYQFRISGDYNLNPHWVITPVGYSFIWNYKYGKQPARYANNEHRIYQQIVFKHTNFRINFNHRLRAEERFLQEHKSSTGEDLGFIRNQLRMRYRGMLTLPINKPKIEQGAISLIIYDEVFMSWGHTSGGALLTYDEPDQNRLFAGLGHQVTKDFSFNFGYFYQYLIKGNGKQQENNFGASVGVTYNLDFTKKELPGL